MEGKRPVSSSFSFTADLFGTKGSPPPSSAGTFASILSPPSMVLGRNTSNSEVMGSWQKQPPGDKEWIGSKKGTEAPSTGGASCTTPNKDWSYILRQEMAEPCHLSSSLYYGGQDIYSHSPSNRASESYPVLKKDGEEDDPDGNNSHGASRGNWWQGSLYY